MNPRARLALGWAGAVVFVAAVVAAAVGFVVLDTDGAQHDAVAAAFADRAALLVIVVAAFAGGLGGFGHWLFRKYGLPAKRLNEETRLILTANCQHRIKPYGAAEMRQLAKTINAFAVRYCELMTDFEQRAAEAKAEVEEEKNRLAALMSELTQSVLVCNIEGRVLLYNQRARQLLNPTGDRSASLVGLGRSLFGVIDRQLVVHALEHLTERIQRADPAPLSSFVTTTRNGQLIRVQMAPVLARNRDITGFVLTLEDIKRDVEIGGRRDVLLQSLTEGMRASLANIRAAVENMISFPTMKPERRIQFTQIISEEAGKLSTRLDHTVAEYADFVKSQWPLETMLGRDVIAAAQRRIETRLGLLTKTEEIEELLWIRADSWSLVQALSYLAGRLESEFGVREVRFRLLPEGKRAALDIIWSGAPLSVTTVMDWEAQPLTMGGETSPLTFKEVLDRHGAEGWYSRDKAAHRAYFRLLLPVTEPEHVWAAPVTLDSRPEYYDFDLFDRPGQASALDDRRLSDLTYTVFDTETTGLNPSAGDEIISIGAVRIVNGRVLQHESFDRLVDPQRPMSDESIRITGLRPEVLRGQPTIAETLPTFHEFCEDTVLVAHNAAFDMRFLQLKEQSTGVRFHQPVLDTLLLDAVLHPNQEQHKLEAIAERLGVSVVGRHTSLGDAIVTAEVFQRMIPLLAAQGITTLKQAREASQQTFYARVEY